MKNSMNKKMIKIIAMVMVVTMLASVCMVEAFAGSVPDNRSFCGYNLYTSITKVNPYKFRCDVLFDVSAAIQIQLYGYYWNYEDPNYDIRNGRYLTASGGGVNYQASVSTEPDYPYLVAWDAYADVSVGYNGQEATRRPVYEADS